MKRIVLIIALFITILEAKAQELSRDYVDVKKELTIEGVDFKDWLDDSTTSATARDAGNGLRLVGNDLDQGGTLDSAVTINGAGYPYNLGTSGSRISEYNSFVSGDYSINATDRVFMSASNIKWTLDGTRYVSSAGDTLASLPLVRGLIESSKPILPYSLPYNFSPTTTNSRPGVGFFRLNNATLANVTEIYIDYFDVNSIAKNPFLNMSDTGTVVSVITDVNNYALYKLTGGYVDNSNYYTYKVAYQSHNGVISGLSIIDIDNSNSTRGGGGGVSDSTFSVIRAEDTLIIGVLDEAILNPSVTDGASSIAYDFGTTNNLVSGTAKVFQFDNSSSNLFYQASSGRLYNENGGFQAGLGTTNYSDFSSTYYRNIVGGSVRLLLNPSISDGVFNVTHTLDSDNDMILGSLLDVSNQGVSIFNVKKDTTTINGLELYTGSANPSKTTRYNANGTIVPYNLWAASPTTVLGNAVIQGTYTGSSLDAGVRGVATNGGIGVIAETVTNGGVAFITKSMSSDAVNSAFIHNSDTILKITKDSISAYKLDANFKSAKVESIYIDGKEIRFNESEGVYEFETGKNEVVWQGALEDLVQVYNNTADTLKNFVPFRFGESLGDTIATALQVGAENIFSKTVQGLITADIPPNDWGFGAIRGYVRGGDLSHLTAAGGIYLSNDSLLTNTPPAYPSNIIVMGGLISNDSEEGILYVDVNLGFQRQIKSKSYTFTSLSVSAGEYWKAGFYDVSTTDANLNEASPSITYGTADISYEAHPLAVYGGVGSVVGVGRVALIVTGTSYSDITGTQTPADVDTIINDITNTALNIYDQAKKYHGTVTYELVVVDGSPSAYSLDFNYGYAKYDDLNDRDFYISAIEAVWIGDGSDATGMDIVLYKHTQTGWTYAATGFEAGNGIIAQRSVDQAGFLRVASGQESSWKRSKLDEFIEGTGEEGYLLKIKTGISGTFQIVDIHVESAIE